MNLELQIYETAMRTTLRRWGKARSTDAIYDAVTEAYTQHLANARKNDTVRAELGTFVAKSASMVLLGRRSRGAQELGAVEWIEEVSGTGSEDGLIELLDATPPPAEVTPAQGAAALVTLLAAGWRATRIAAAVGCHESLVCIWRKGHSVSPKHAALLLKLVGTPPPPRPASRPMGPRIHRRDGLDPDVVARAIQRPVDMDMSGGTA